MNESVDQMDCNVRHFVIVAEQEMPIDFVEDMAAAEQAMRDHGVKEAVIWKCVGESCNAVETTDRIFAR